MKTAEQALEEWVNDEIFFDGGVGAGEAGKAIGEGWVKFNRHEMGVIARGIREDRDDIEVAEYKGMAQGMSVADVIYWPAAKIIRSGAEALGIMVNALWLIRFDSLNEAHTFIYLRCHEKGLIQDSTDPVWVSSGQEAQKTQE